VAAATEVGGCSCRGYGGGSEAPAAEPDVPTPLRVRDSDYHLSDEQRRTCIAVYFVDVLGAPETADWGGHDGTISIIQRKLAFPDGSRDIIKQILTDVVECHSKGVVYSAGRKNGSGGGSKLIILGSVEAQIVAGHCAARRQAGEEGSGGR